MPTKPKKKKRSKEKDQMEINFNPGIFSDEPFMITITSSEGWSIKIVKE